MPVGRLRVLAAAKLHHPDFLPAPVAHHRRRHLAARQVWTPQRNPLAVADQQHLVDLDLAARLGVDLLDFQTLARGDPMLLPTAFDNREHAPTFRLSKGAAL